jgi:hypothetical protein
VSNPSSAGTNVLTAEMDAVMREALAGRMPATRLRIAEQITREVQHHHVALVPPVAGCELCRLLAEYNRVMEDLQ